jgi:hypothetical protein
MGQQQLYVQLYGPLLQLCHTLATQELQDQPEQSVYRSACYAVIRKA